MQMEHQHNHAGGPPREAGPARESLRGGVAEAAPDALGQLDDSRLVVLARTEPEAFGVLYRRHYPAIARYVRRRVGDGHFADDVVAEAFTVALGKLGAYRDRGLSLRAWLYGIASRVLGSALRSRGRRVVEELALEPVAPETRGAEEQDDADHLRRELLRLPIEQQTTLSLHYLEGLGVDEIAAALGVRPGTVKARLSRGRDRLRERMGVRPRVER